MTSLQFQDFSTQPDQGDANSSNPEYKPPTGRIGDRDELFSRNYGRDPSIRHEDGAKKNFFSFEFYQQYFDVDTDQVLSRILNSMIPRFRSNFITDRIQPMPDFYGPFWICVTLVFTTAICGNLAKYIETHGDVKNNYYGSDFRLVTGASTLIACYVILVPFALYAVFWYRKSEVQYTYLEILCAYGYSLSIFVPVSILWVINVQWFRWLLIVLSVVLSGTVLISSVWPALRMDRNRTLALGTVAVVILLHALLAVGFKEFYFDASHPSSNSAPHIAPEAPAAADEATAASKIVTMAAKLVNDTVTNIPVSANTTLKEAVASAVSSVSE